MGFHVLAAVVAFALPWAGQVTQDSKELLLDGLGIGLAAMGDVDGDGYADFAAGAPKENDPDDPHSRHPDTGEVLLFSGRTFEPLWRRRAKDSTYFGDQLVAVDDLDEDGAGELAVASAEQVWMLSGATGETLWTMPVGRWVTIAAVSDVDADGHVDLAAAFVGEGSEPMRCIRLLSGRNGKVRWSREADECGSYDRRWAGVGVRDRNGDGCGDLLSLGWIEESSARTTAAVAISGKDGSTLELDLLPYVAFDSARANAFRLVVVGTAPSESRETLALSDGRGRAWLVPGGRWGAPIAVGTPTQHKLFGTAIAGVPDLDGDEAPDVLVTGKLEIDQEIDDGYFWAYSGTTGLELPEWKRSSASLLSGGFGFGERICALGDVDADGTPDLVVAVCDDELGSRYPGALVVLGGVDGRVLEVIR